jgi:hypothetical protein
MLHEGEGMESLSVALMPGLEISKRQNTPGDRSGGSVFRNQTGPANEE